MTRRTLNQVSRGLACAEICFASTGETKVDPRKTISVVKWVFDVEGGAGASQRPGFASLRNLVITREYAFAMMPCPSVPF